MMTKDKVTDIFCIIDEFDKNLSAECAKNLRLPNQDGNGFLLLYLKYLYFFQNIAENLYLCS